MKCCAAATRPRSTSGWAWTWIPPELRENRGELEAARERMRCPTWSSSSRSAGDLHSHTDWTDGKATLEQMVKAAIEHGARLRAITDHSPAVGFGMGLDAGRLRRQIERVRDAGRRAGARLHAAGRRRGGHPQGRLARLLGRAARRSWTWSWRACTRPTGCRRRSRPRACARRCATRTSTSSATPRAA